MSHTRAQSVESICSVLSCTCNEFLEFFEGSYSTDVLADYVRRNAIDLNRDKLRLADNRYRLDELLGAMLEHSPHPLGKRYVAVALHIAHEKGPDAVVDLAKAWLDYLFFPVLAKYKTMKTEPSSSQTPTMDETMQQIESATRSEKKGLKEKLVIRSNHRCEITRSFDAAYVRKAIRLRQPLDVPEGVPQLDMHVAHIIPFSLYEFKSGTDNNPETKAAARTRDMLCSWTQTDLNKLVGEKINSPANAIYMTIQEHRAFGSFEFYLDKEAFPDNPHKYKLKMTQPVQSLSNGLRSVDVEFANQEQPHVEPPDPELLKVHAAFAKVLHLSGVAEYVDSVEWDAEMGGTLHLNGKTDFETLLRLRLSVLSNQQNYSI